MTDPNSATSEPDAPAELVEVIGSISITESSKIYRDKMYLLPEEELMMERTIASGNSSGNSFHCRQELLESQRVNKAWKRVLKRCFQRIDEMDFVTFYECGIGNPCGCGCGCPPHTLGLGGFTVVLAILTEKTIIVANYGDSRAVLSLGGRVMPLSIDHKLFALCNQRLHVLVEEELMRSRNNAYMSSSNSNSSVNGGQQEWEATWRRML